MDNSAPARGFDGAALPDGETPGQEFDGSGLAGPDLARAALQAAREQSAAKRKERGKTGKPGKLRTARRRRGWTGAGPDERDPQPLGRLAARIAKDHGWTEHLSGGQVFARWNSLVGEEIAEHTKPVQLKDGELTVQAQSTAWATQLRLLQRQILKRISDGVGRDVVKRIKVQGPAAPSWRHGPRHISGRGPRDTYG
ncbi:DciA family protein [Saccharopolyspora mangrovi]|uniref:DciA family protein n=1 Tax=Saccharopolyspora mangrovi TaxID=3082379 RepID=UPI00389A8A94